jgi:hypothetical protein
MTGVKGGDGPGVWPGWRWDVALSFAGAQRGYVEQVAGELGTLGVRCFYDADEQIELWGRHLPEELPAIYGEQAAAVVVFVSAEYIDQDWTRLELRAALDRAVRERREYVLPARFDDTLLPGLLPGVVYADLRTQTPQQFAKMVASKLAELARAAPGTGPTADTPASAAPAGTVVAWGGNQFGSCNVPDGLTEVVAVAAGECHSLALTSKGTVVAWGDNSIGQCEVPPWLTGVTAIAAGGGLSFALTSAGTVAAWGNRRYRQCDVPDGLTGVSAIAAGFNYGLAVSDGKVVGWGVEAPAMRDIPPGLTGVVAVAASTAHSLALTREGTVVTWGAPAEEELPENAKLSARLLSWVNRKLGPDLQVPSGLTQVIGIAVGSTYSMALNSEGTVVGWGRFFSTSPFRVSGGPSYSVPEDLPRIVAIASGANHSLALTSSGTVEAWGHNHSGQCEVPDGLTGVIGIAAGHNHCLAVTSQNIDT